MFLAFPALTTILSGEDRVSVNMHQPLSKKGKP